MTPDAKTNSAKMTVWAFLQTLGKTFMLPVASLAFCGILLGVGSAFSGKAAVQAMPWLGFSGLQAFFVWISAIGTVAIQYLPMLFAVSIPLGMVKIDKGVAALAGLAGFLAHITSVHAYLQIAGILEDAQALEHMGVREVLGVLTVDTGVLGGILVGLLVAWIHERYHDLEVPDAFAFFGGTRSVPIISILACGAGSLFVPVLWAYISLATRALGALITQTGPFGPFFFGLGETLLRPVGLHHILVALIRFTEAGGTLDVCGQTVQGALNIFYAQAKCVDTTAFAASATRFLSQGKMPSYMGGLPGAALAMYHMASPKNKIQVKGLLISGVVAVFIGGITEPLEFLFLFASPLLYALHAILVGLGFMVMSILQVTIGNTDGNIIDFIVFGVLKGTQTRWYIAIPVICAWGLIYYGLFCYMIQRYQLLTPGRDTTEPLDLISSNAPAVSQAMLACLGGAENISMLDNCITRLRISVQDMSQVDAKALKKQGALGVVILDPHNLQVIIGPQVQKLKDAMLEEMRNRSRATARVIP